MSGYVRPHHRFMLAERLAGLDFLDAPIATLEAHREAVLARMPPVPAAAERRATTPGSERPWAILSMAAMGVALRRFPRAQQLPAWAGVAPGQNATGGNPRTRKPRKGTRSGRWGLVPAAPGAAGKPGAALKALSERLAARRGKARAGMAVGRQLLVIASHLRLRGTPEQEHGEDYRDQPDPVRRTKRLVQRLDALGDRVSLTVREGVATAAAVLGGAPARSPTSAPVGVT